MSEFEIESGIEVPPPGTGKHNQKYPFADMKIGDSFFCSINAEGLQRQTEISAVRNAARGFSNRNCIELVARVVKEERGRGVRVWRVS